MIPYLQLDNLTKSWGDLPLFKDISFTINQGDKVALIAKNGAGKTTLMNILYGGDIADSGKVIFNNDIRIGYLRQLPELNPDETILEAAFSSSGETITAVREYESALESHDPKAIDKAMDKINRLNCWDFELKIKQILTELNIHDLQQPIRELSGGQKKRVALAHVMIDEPDFLILDEPTNHLDLEMIEWLERTLEKSKCTLLMVTHDRYFLDRVCNEIVELDDQSLFRYKGNYSYYVEKRNERIQNLTQEIERAKNLFRTELDWLRRMPQARSHKSKYRTENAYILKEKASKRLDEKKLELAINSQRLGGKIINLEALSKSFGDITILKDFSYKFARHEKIGIVGKNGSGKSTFLNLLTGLCQPDSGKMDVGETVSFGYFRQDGIQFSPENRVIDIIKEIAEVVEMGDGSKLSASQFLTYFLFPPDTQYSLVAKLSGGEKRRLYLCTILMRNPNFLILDEPTNDLDIMTLNVLEDYLKSFTGCTIVVSHDRFFMDKIVDHLFVFEGDGVIKDFPGNYTEYRDWVEDRAKAEQSAIKIDKPVREKMAPEKRKPSFKEKKELDDLEKEIGHLEKEKKELEDELNSGTLAADALHKKSTRYSEITTLLEEKEFRWLELSDLE
ncbi:MAG: ABC-F family ATP-binding cassette domain-containing protein [Prolixibacteraceae bacterium]|jgi:ATP-binding cassette subfamily F protein uup|nr:ABC-F family ATP-binding cassette domain-containing protein [Prolixibacteraceae bacterium]